MDPKLQTFLETYGDRLHVLVMLAFVFNIFCYLHTDAPTDFYKLVVQQLLILTLGEVGTKLDRLHAPRG